MVIDGDILSIVDYRAKNAVELLNQFNRIRTGDTCAGHIQEGDHRIETAIRYVPGLKEIKENSWYDKELNSIKWEPEYYELDGKPIKIRELKAGAFCHNDSLIINPLDFIYRADHKNLFFTGSYLTIGVFEKNHANTEELEKRLKKLYQKFEDCIQIRYRDSIGFSISKKRFNPNLYSKLELKNIKEEHGSIENYWLHAIDTVVSLQNTVDCLWKDIAQICSRILDE